MDNLENTSNREGQKRLIGTLDPDYISPPDTKKIKLLQAKGEEEFYGRVVKVVEKQFMSEIERKNCEIEEIDDKILKVQQCLHTLRYCVSLNCYAFGKFKGNTQSDHDKNQTQVNHPLIQQYLGDASTSVESLPTSEALSAKQERKADGKSSFTECHSQKENSKKEAINSDSSNKKIEPPQTTCEVISQGRQGRYQKKIRVVIGNTYQYIPNSEDVEDHLKFKWRVYVRGPPEDGDISNVISSVKFTLDKSYSPHDVIVVSEPPFLLSRRGWGEFKIYLELTFKDSRNKPIQMMHHLTLARADDPLAFTGIWRLGKEMWYDIWLYMKSTKPPDTTSIETSEPKTAEDIETSLKALKERGMRSEMLYSDSEGHLTLAHTYDTEVITPSVTKPLQDPQNQNHLNSNTNLNSDFQKEYLLMNGNTENLDLVESSNNSNRIEKKPSPNFPKFAKYVNNKGEQKLHKILIRQADGSLVSWMVPRNMYDMALKFSEKNMNKAGAQSGIKTNANSKQTDATPKGINMTPTSNSDIIPPKTSPLSVYAQKNGVVNSLSLSNSLKQASFLNASSAAVEPAVPLGENSRGTLIRFSPLLQKQLLIGSANNSLQHQNATGNSPQSRTTLIKVAPEGGATAIRVNTSMCNGSATTKIDNPTSLGGLVGSASSPIRLSVSTLSPNNAKVIKTALIGSTEKKPPTISVNLKKAPTMSLTGQPLPSLANLNGVSSITSQVRPQQQSKITLLNNGIRVNTNQIVRATTLTTDGVSPLPALQKSGSLTLPVPLREVVSVMNDPSVPVPQSYVSPQGKIATRRIFISAPPHLVKLREAALAGGKQGSQTPPKQQKDDSGRPKGKTGLKKLVEEIENEASSLKNYEDRRKMLRETSSHCTSVDEIIRIYMKGLPLFLTEETRSDWHLPFTSLSLEHFNCNLVGRRRALEFWRAREIKKELELLKPPDWRAWSVVKIVSWARRHKYTPTSTLSPSSLERLCSCPRKFKQSSSTITILEESPTKSVQSPREEKLIPRPGFDLEDCPIVIDAPEDKKSSNTEKSQGNQELHTHSLKKNETPILVVTPHTAEQSHFLDLCLSKVRLKLEPEEIIPGVKMNAAKSVLWKAMLSFMEDVLRSTYAEATLTANNTRDETEAEDGEIEDKADSEVKLEAKHLLSALRNGRPQFELFTQFNLGTKSHVSIFDENAL